MVSQNAGLFLERAVRLPLGIKFHRNEDGSILHQMDEVTFFVYLIEDKPYVLGENEDTALHYGIRISVLESAYSSTIKLQEAADDFYKKLHAL